MLYVDLLDDPESYRLHKTLTTNYLSYFEYVELGLADLVEFRTVLVNLLNQSFKGRTLRND